MSTNSDSLITQDGSSPESRVNLDLSRLLACPDCDLLLVNEPVKPGQKLVCPRCDSLLHAPKDDSVGHSLALSLTGLILFPFAIFMPIMTLDTMGIKNSATIFDGIISTWNTGYLFVAVILAMTSMIFPLIKLLLIFCVSLNLTLERTPGYLAPMMRIYVHTDEWGMLEVFMIGILVTIIKMHHMASIHYDIGFFCFIALMLTALGSSLILDKDVFWQQIELEKG
ncbi:MAG: paraquat-inducible protein A [Deltaproteobacteria bacterium]|nr:paraquat-inducible protein A [Deltaproteobacteria bacterium]